MEGISTIPSARRRLPAAFFRLVAVVSVMVGLSACSTVELVVYGDDMTGDERLIREQSYDFVLTNVIEGAVVVGTVGCVVGAVALAVASQSGGDMVTACLALGALGAVAGGVDGYGNAAYAGGNAREVMRLREQANRVVESNDELRMRLAAARRVLEADRDRLATLRKVADQKWYQFEFARNERDKIVSNNAAIRRVIETARDQLEEYEADTTDYASEDRLRTRQSISALEGEVEELEAMLSAASNAMRMAGIS